MTIDLAVMSRDEGGRLARDAIAVVSRAVREVSLEMEGWRCVLLLPVFTDALRQRIGLWRVLLRIRAVVEGV